MRRFLVLAVLAAVVGATGAAAQAPPRVCEGLTICSPVAGPWVVVPAPVPPARVGTAVWLLGCPDGFVGGLDARVANPWVQVRFPGLMGSPVNPGITTRKDTVFLATSVGSPGRTSSFIPFIGCIPAEGGPRTPTGVGSIARPEQLGTGPIIRIVRTVEVRQRAGPRRPRLPEGAAPGRLDRLAGDLHGAPSDPAAAREGARDDEADQGTRLDHGEPQRPRHEDPGPGADPRPLHSEVSEMRSLAFASLLLAGWGKLRFPPRAPFFQRPMLIGEPPGSPRTPPPHEPGAGS